MYKISLKPAPFGGTFDAQYYVSMYKGEKVDNIYWPSRLVTVALARAIPDLPLCLFNPVRQGNDLWQVTVKFGIVNFILLVATGILFFYFLSFLGYSFLESIIGILFFYTARPVVQYSAVPMVEAAGYFFLLLCLYAILKENLFIVLDCPIFWGFC